jgi:hypothetical protein
MSTGASREGTGPFESKLPYDSDLTDGLARTVIDRGVSPRRASSALFALALPTGANKKGGLMKPKRLNRKSVIWSRTELFKARALLKAARMSPLPTAADLAELEQVAREELTRVAERLNQGKRWSA